MNEKGQSEPRSTTTLCLLPSRKFTLFQAPVDGRSTMDSLQDFKHIKSTMSYRYNSRVDMRVQHTWCGLPAAVFHDKEVLRMANNGK